MGDGVCANIGKHERTIYEIHETSQVDVTELIKCHYPGGACDKTS